MAFEIGTTKLCGKCYVEVDNRDIKRGEIITGELDLPILGALCGTCQTDRFTQMEELYNKTIAIFYTCMILDVPFFPSCVVLDDVENTWLEYVQQCLWKNKKKFEEGDFNSGVTNVLDIYENTNDVDALKKAMLYEKDAIGKSVGNRNQRRNWGEHKGYTEEDFKELDKLYIAFASDLGGVDAIDGSREVVLRECCEMWLKAQELARRGEYQEMKRLHDMISKIRADEQLRKKDTLPIEELRVDSMAIALEKYGLTNNGKLKSLKEVQDIFLERMGVLGIKGSEKYKVTIDAADQMIHIINNTIRRNDGLAEFSEIDDLERLDDNVRQEFASAPSEDEKEVYEILGLSRERN